MTSTPQSPIPDTPVEPVTPERISELLDAEGLQHRLESAPVAAGESPATIVRTGFLNTAIAISIDGDQLVCDSMWRGEIPKDDAPKVLGLCNSWNQAHFMPTMRFFENSAGTGHLTASAHRQVDITHGLSRNQIGAFLMSTFDGILRAYEFIEGQFPELVTWEEPHNA